MHSTQSCVARGRRPTAFGEAPRARACVELIEPRRLLAMIHVTTLADSGAGSLRDAITQANAMSGDDTIVFDSGLTGTVPLLSALPVLSSNMEIQGPGQSLLNIRRSSAPNYNIFSVAMGATVTLAGLTVSNGRGPGIGADGGGLQNRGTLTLLNCTVSGNSAGATGGGIYNRGGTLYLTNTTVSGNSAVSGGGGIYSLGTVHATDSTITGNSVTSSFAAGGGIYSINGTVNFNRCRITGNSAPAGGGGALSDTASTMTFVACTIGTNSAGFSGAGVMNAGTARLTNCILSGNFGIEQGSGGGAIRNGGTLSLANCTLTGNSVRTSGGGILNHGPLTLTNCTVTNNRAGSITFGGEGGGIQNTGAATTTLHNTIVAGNFRGTGTSADDVHIVDGTVSGSFSLIGVTTRGTLSGNSNLIGVDPLLGPLDDNGGPTLTHALHLESPAIDGGSNALAVNPQGGDPLPTDQRGTGFQRVVGASVEIGAFEAQTRAPDVLEPTFHFATLPMALRLWFNSDVSASLDLGDVAVRNLTTQTTINPTSLQYDANTDVATFSFAGILPDGKYRATITAAGVTGSNGLPMVADEVFDFLFLMADADHDGLVNLQDFNRLAANFGQTPRDFTQGDFNYDSFVNLSDFNILASRFGQALPATAGRDGATGSSSDARPSVSDEDPLMDLLA